MQVMKERDGSKLVSGTIQLDDVYLGGERHGGKNEVSQKRETVDNSV